MAVRSTAPDPYRDRYAPHVLADGSVDRMLWEIREVRALPVPEDYVPVEFPLSISIDAEPRTFIAVGADTWWMALSVGSDASIKITARGFSISEVELVRISEFRRYFEDLRDWRA